jgi:hypothetical protein
MTTADALAQTASELTNAYDTPTKERVTASAFTMQFMVVLASLKWSNKLLTDWRMYDYAALGNN